MTEYQDEFKCILDEEVSDYVARALGLLTQAIQGGHAASGAVAINRPTWQ